ncbi:unnamed protein product [Scytosiphon promiscuus]
MLYKCYELIDEVWRRTNRVLTLIFKTGKHASIRGCCFRISRAAIRSFSFITQCSYCTSRGSRFTEREDGKKTSLRINIDFYCRSTRFIPRSLEGLRGLPPPCRFL